MRRALQVVLVALLFSSLVWAGEPEQSIDPAWSDRYYSLIDELRCLVCQNQNLAESNAPLATDLREEVKEMLAAGKSDAEIKRFLTDRYGDFVLYRPPFKSRTWLLWLGPFALLAVALFIALRVARRRPAQSSESVDPEELRKILHGDDQ